MKACFSKLRINKKNHRIVPQTATFSSQTSYRKSATQSGQEKKTKDSENKRLCITTTIPRPPKFVILKFWWFFSARILSKLPSWIYNRKTHFSKMFPIFFLNSKKNHWLNSVLKYYIHRIIFFGLFLKFYFLGLSGVIL